MTEPYVYHSETSREAAGKIVPSSATLRETVYEYILLRGRDGATDHEVQEATSMDPSTQRPRRVELAKAGRIVKTSKTRKTPSGRAAAVWVASVYDDNGQGRLF